jgi:hypothetical protein
MNLNNKPAIRNKWLELHFGWIPFSLSYSIGSYFDQRHMLHIGFIFFNLYLHLPWKTKRPKGCEYPTYGIDWVGGGKCLLRLGEKSKLLYFPWSWEWQSASYLKKDGTYFVDDKKNRKGNKLSDYKDFWDDHDKSLLWVEKYPYRYVLKSGKVQDVIATVTIEVVVWKPLWFQWQNLIKNTYRGIAIVFSGEVGEGSGGWKGGCIGCGYTQKKGETPEHTLRRMEKEKKF